MEPQAELARRKQYELAFHLSPSFNEPDLENKKRELEEFISKNGGLISRSGEIKKMRLAYPIKKERFSNFGYIEFLAAATDIEKINKNLLADENLLRYLIIKKEEKTARLTKLKISKPRKEISALQRPPLEPGQVGAEDKTEDKELDKKIEEILEKL